MKKKIGILGATGYTGAGLVKLLSNHPEVEVAYVSSETYAGKTISSVYPHLSAVSELDLITIDNALELNVELVFSCLPHKTAMETVPKLVEKGIRVIDLSADFRMDSAAAYEKWYDTEHIAHELLQKKVYGLPEIYRERIADAPLIGLPGCYPTSIILGLLPFLKKGLINPATIIADCKSGVSGAGRSLSLKSHFVEANENFAPYNIGHSHRHVGEIEQELSKLADSKATVIFSPHLVPMNRGILSTIYVEPLQEQSTDDLLQCLHEAYDDEPFVRIRNTLPETAFVKDTNFLDVTALAVPDTGRAIVVTAEDNLVKGAYGQGVQCLNIMYGWPETTGLLGV